MKIRQDFVTNSSSSSFLLARKGGLSKKQKDALASFVEENFLGSPVPTEEEEFRAYLREHYMSEDSEWAKKMREIIREGKTPWCGRVSFEADAMYDTMVDLYGGIWSVLEGADPERFEGIETELSY